MKTYLKKYGIKLLVLVLLVAAVTGIGHHLRQGAASAAADAAGAVRTPFQKVATALVGRMEDLYGVLFRYDTLKEENEQLRAQIADLQKQQMAEAQATEENQRLRELLNLSEKHSDFKYESAKVVSWNASNWNSSFTISKGSDSGLEVGDCVITEYGVADLRGKCAMEKAAELVKVAHPDYRPLLREYLKDAAKYGGHTPHNLQQALSWHTRYLDTGTMLPG